MVRTSGIEHSFIDRIVSGPLTIVTLPLSIVREKSTAEVLNSARVCGTKLQKNNHTNNPFFPRNGSNGMGGTSAITFLHKNIIIL